MGRGWWRRNKWLFAGKYSFYPPMLKKKKNILKSCSPKSKRIDVYHITNKDIKALGKFWVL